MRVHQLHAGFAGANGVPQAQCLFSHQLRMQANVSGLAFLDSTSTSNEFTLRLGACEGELCSCYIRMVVWFLDHD